MWSFKVSIFVHLTFCLLLAHAQQQNSHGVNPGQHQPVQQQQFQQGLPPPQQQQFQQGQPQQFPAQPNIPLQQVPQQQFQQAPQQQIQQQVPQQQFQQPQQHFQQPLQHGQQPPQPGHQHGGGQPRVLHRTTEDMKHEQEHVKEHVDASVDTSNMSEQELQFHYFKMHDSDGNNKLDGCELVKSLIHWHDSSNHDEKSDQPLPEEKIFKDDELVSMIDPILETDDKNKDGYIDYSEFVIAQQAAQTQQAKQ